nr:MAG TPA: hypothetical protein [Caudoviricetes sp.]
MTKSMSAPPGALFANRKPPQLYAAKGFSALFVCPKEK